MTSYHTYTPILCRTLERLAQVRCVQCRDGLCDCSLSAYLVERSSASVAAPEHERRTATQESNQAPKRCGISRPRAAGTRTPQNKVKYALNVYINKVTEPEGAGEGLFFKRAMKKGDMVGIYENYTGGQRLTSGNINAKLRLSDYAIEYEGLVRDVWDPVF